MAPNPYILAADNSPALLPLLRAKPELACQQDDHGYSLVHAAASYNHLDLLRTLVRELRVPVDLRDEDRETALFVVETVEAARCLVEELGLDPALRGDLDLTAAEKIAAEGEFPLVAAYLQGLDVGAGAGDDATAAAGAPTADTADVLVDEMPAPPAGMTVTMGTMLPASDVPSTTVAAADAADTAAVAANPGDDDDAPDPEVRRRIEELAARPDFHTEQGQAALRQLVEDVLSGQHLAEDRHVRARRA
ncbi:ankyrin repeat protein [Niveomyces insectorum RCEF 264]|uniref:Ankyrin repeat protein n=1 Tax=Niveomyces insectorum RCEF 264 TaxID=1081102 RepID=A0A162KB77_9HYPO|nr:ankyrin repeat protein [Niveomyces insectorum RCEF 264]